MRNEPRKDGWEAKRLRTFRAHRGVRIGRTLDHQDSHGSDGPKHASGRASLPAEDSMAKCEVCGNDYDKSFTVTMKGKAHTFDSFECAIHALAPHCAHCDCRIIGHGMESNGTFYCCANCARMSGVKGLDDRV